MSAPIPQPFVSAKRKPSERPEVSSPEVADRVFRWIRDNAQDGTIAVAARDIAAELDISRGTALNAIRRLTGEGRLAIVRKGTGWHHPTVYRIHA